MWCWMKRACYGVSEDTQCIYTMLQNANKCHAMPVSERSKRHAQDNQQPLMIEHNTVHRPMQMLK
jgi:hypothetical protein